MTRAARAIPRSSAARISRTASPGSAAEPQARIAAAPSAGTAPLTVQLYAVVVGSAGMLEGMGLLAPESGGGARLGDFSDRARKIHRFRFRSNAFAASQAKPGGRLPSRTGW